MNTKDYTSLADMVRSHLVCALDDAQMSRDQISNIAIRYGARRVTARKMADDLVKSGFLQKVGTNFKIRGWIVRLVKNTPNDISLLV